ncbi:restriction endonuclease subunit S [Asaia spathodeae]|uniref:restriction endonuclease subunit S n=1 Tax=Asaia spathodeae TaxID=657016 RepID=UPI002FC28201
MIFSHDPAQIRLKWAFDSCKNGAWGDEPDGESDAVCIRAADFSADLGVLADGQRTLRAIDDATYRKVGLREGDLVVEKSGGGEKQLVGRSVIYDGRDRAVCSNFLARCRPSDLVTSEYLNYVMLGIYKARGTYPHIKQTTGIQNLDMASFLNTRVTLPPLDTQKRIATFLDEKTAQIDGLIEKKRALLERLAEKRQAIITQAVTKGLNPAAPMKDSGIDWLGLIPAHWEVGPLKRYLAESLYGVSASLQPTGEVAILRMGNLQDGELDFSDLRFLDQVESTLLLKTQDVVFNRTNSLDLVGKAAIYRDDYEGALSLASYLVIFRFDDRYDPEFANYVMGTNVLMALGRTLALPSIGQANLNPNRYAAISFPVPPLAEQKAIATYIADQLAQLKVLETQIRASVEKLTGYRSALITAAVTGQIDGLR